MLTIDPVSLIVNSWEREGFHRRYIAVVPVLKGYFTDLHEALY